MFELTSLLALALRLFCKDCDNKVVNDKHQHYLRLSKLSACDDANDGMTPYQHTPLACSDSDATC